MLRRGFLKSLVGIPAAFTALAHANVNQPLNTSPTDIRHNAVTVATSGAHYRIGALYPDGHKEVFMIRVGKEVADPTTAVEQRLLIDIQTLYRASYIRNLTTGEVIKNRWSADEHPEFSGLTISTHSRYHRSMNHES